MVFALALAGCSLIFPFDVSDLVGDSGQLPEGGVIDGSAETRPGTDADLGTGLETAPNDLKQLTDVQGSCIPKPCPAPGWCPMKLDGSISGSTKLLGIWGTELKHLWAVGTQSTLLRYDPTSCTWLQHDLAADLGSVEFNKVNGRSLNGVWGSSPSDVYVVGDDDVILHFDGAKWIREPLTPADGKQLLAVGGRAPHEIVAVGVDGRVYNRSSGPWQAWPNSSTETLHGVTGPAASGPVTGSTFAIYAAGTGGEFLYHDGVSKGSFANMPSSCLSSFNWQAIWASPVKVGGQPAAVVVGDKGGLMLMYTSAVGVTCKPSSYTGLPLFRAVGGRVSPDIWVAGEKSKIIHYTGTAWKDESPATTSKDLLGIWVSPSGKKRVIVVGDALTVLYRDY